MSPKCVRNRYHLETKTTWKDNVEEKTVDKYPWCTVIKNVLKKYQEEKFKTHKNIHIL